MARRAGGRTRGKSLRRLWAPRRGRRRRSCGPRSTLPSPPRGSPASTTDSSSPTSRGTGEGIRGGRPQAGEALGAAGRGRTRRRRPGSSIWQRLVHREIGIWGFAMSVDWKLFMTQLGCME
uniref:Survival motor neuron containing protein n=1 Tax=Arundo donax TaxID=35708 RepID=A0A0A9GEK3_ARUDO